jgi:dTDP-4-dehydrorhamnose 3,5-epimerase
MESTNSILKKDKQTVTIDGEHIGERIHGFILKRLRSIEDKRGDITEMYCLDWKLHPEPMVFAYQVTIRPKAIRGWEMHKKQDDRIFISKGSQRWVLYDNRPDSPTYKMVNVFVLSELNRVTMIVPKGVVHAVENVGNSDAIFINFPTKPFNHADPDKWRFPLKNDIIPFDFDDSRGW